MFATLVRPAGASLVVSAPARAAVNTAAPAAPVKLIFIHHSTGQDWLADGHGQLGIALRDNSYFVSDTNYGWGGALALSRGEPVGSTTDIGDWWTWFRGANAAAYMTALFAESGQNCSYSRLAADPGGANEIVMFKSCFPNSQLSGSGADPVPLIADNPLKGQAVGGDAFTVANAKGIYIDLLGYFADHQEKLFVVIVAPPVTSPDTPGGRTLATWLVDHWLQDAAYAHDNVAVFDYYTVLSSNGGSSGVNDLGATPGNHHRIWNGAVQHVTNDGVNHLAYPSAGGDSHPNADRRPQGHGRIRAAPQQRLQRLEGQRRFRHDRSGDVRAAPVRRRQGQDGDPLLPGDRRSGRKLHGDDQGQDTRRQDGQDAASRPEGLRHPAPRALPLHPGQENLPLLRLRA